MAEPAYNEEKESTSVRIDRLARKFHALKSASSELSAALRDAKKEEDSAKGELIEAMDDIGTERFQLPTGVCVLRGSTIVPTVKDWDAFYEYIKKEDALYMLERRAAVSPYRELREQGREVPGVVDYAKPKVTVTLP